MLQLLLSVVLVLFSQGYAADPVNPVVIDDDASVPVNDVPPEQLVLHDSYQGGGFDGGSYEVPHGQQSGIEFVENQGSGYQSAGGGSGTGPSWVKKRLVGVIRGHNVVTQTGVRYVTKHGVNHVRIPGRSFVYQPKPVAVRTVVAAPVYTAPVVSAPVLSTPIASAPIYGGVIGTGIDFGGGFIGAGSYGSLIGGSFGGGAGSASSGSGASSYNAASIWSGNQAREHASRLANRGGGGGGGGGGAWSFSGLSSTGFGGYGGGTGGTYGGSAGGSQNTGYAKASEKK